MSINPTAFTLAQLTIDQKQTVQTYVIGYKTPGKACSDQIASLAYRIWNAIKAIFGMSDWQMATKIIEYKVTEEAANIGDLTNLEFKRFVDITAADYASKVLLNALNEYNLVDDTDFVAATDLTLDLNQIKAKIQNATTQMAQGPIPPLRSSAASSAHLDASDPFTQVINDTPEFDFYKIGKGTAYAGSSLSGMSIRPANLFFQALGAETTMPGSGQLFRFANPAKVRLSIMEEEPETVAKFTANGQKGRSIVDLGLDPKDLTYKNHLFEDRPVADLSEIYGTATYRISYKELQETLDSQKIYCSSMLPKRFYQSLKNALIADGHVVLPGTDGVPMRLKDIPTKHCLDLIEHCQQFPEQYNFESREALDALLNLSIYQIGAMVVKTEDFRIFTDGNGRILERNPGEQDAIRLINACGIRGIRATPGPINTAIMTKTFEAALEAAEDGIVVFPAVGMGVWKGNPEIYWNAFFSAIAYAGDTFEKIFVNPRHQNSTYGKYVGRDGSEFAEILAQQIEFHTQRNQHNAVANLKKIVNLYDQKSDLLQLAHNLKKANPAKTVSIFNASDPDVTLGNHVTEYMNNRPHGASTTEEHYSMMGTNGLCFESITGIHIPPGDRIIQVE